MINKKERSVSSVKSKLVIDRASFQGRKNRNLSKKSGEKNRIGEQKQAEKVQVNSSSKKDIFRQTYSVENSGQEEPELSSKTAERTMSGFFPKVKSRGNIDYQVARRTQKSSTLYLNKTNQKTTIQEEEEIECTIQELTQQLVKTLINNNFITKQAKTTLSVPEIRFGALVAYLIDALTLPSREEIKRKNPDFYFAVHLLPKIAAYRQQFNQAQLENNQLQLKKIKELVRNRKSLVEEIVGLQSQLNLLKKVQQQIAQKEERLSELKRQTDQIATIKDKLKSGLSQLLSIEGLHEKLRLKFNSFHLKEENSIIYQKRSKEYKDIENYLFEYATYLSNNKVLVSFDYDPEPFQQDESKIQIRMRQIFGYLEQLPEKQHQALKTKLLIQDLQSYHRSVEGQLLRLCNLKTNAVKCFIRNIRFWLKNWQFKQDVLTDIKKLFIIDSIKLRHKFDEYKQIIKDLKLTDQKIHLGLLSEMSSIFEEMVQFYAIGNSFY